MYRKSTTDPHSLFAGNLAQYLADKKWSSSPGFAAEEVLSRFRAQVGWVTQSVATSFNLQPHELDDLKQEANVLILTYAGLMDGWSPLPKWEAEANGDEKQVKALLATQLRLDLCRSTARRLDREVPTVSLDALTEEGFDVAYESFEDQITDVMDGVSHEAKLRDLYPYFCLRILDDMSPDEIAKKMGVSRATAFRRLTEEKAAFTAEHENEYTTEEDDDIAI